MATPRSSARPRRGAATGAGVSWLAPVALFLLTLALYGRGFAVGFVGDDYTLLDAARRLSLGELLTGRHGIIGYYRPVSRELYFWLWGRVLGFGPLGFHLVNLVTFGFVSLFFYAMLRRWQGARVATIGTLAFAVFPPIGALLSWISCAQDLIVLFWGTLAMLLYRERRYTLAGAAGFLAALSKETGLIVPFALLALEVCAGEPGRSRRLPSRLAPAFIGLAAAIAVGVGVRLGWPSGTAVAVWSPAQALGAWRIPLDFVSTWVPPSTVAGVIEAGKRTPLLLGCVAVLGFLAAPGGGRSTPSARAVNHPRGAMLFGFLLLVLGLLPVSVIVERWRAYFFGFSALGAGTMIGVTLAQTSPWVARVLGVVAAVVCFGSNSIYRAVDADYGPAKHAFANYAFFRDNAEFSSRLIGSLEPWCQQMKESGRVFTVGIPDDFAFDNLLGPARRVACRDTVDRLRRFEEFGPADAAGDFGLLRFDPSSQTFEFQPSSLGERVRMGESFLMKRRYDVAGNLYAAAAGEPRADVSFGYIAVAALGAGGDTASARRLEARLEERGRAFSPDRLLRWLLAEVREPIHEGLRNRLELRAERVLDDPLDGDEHAGLGYRLLEAGAARHAARELVLGYGLARRPSDLLAFAETCARLGANADARAAFEHALELPLGPGETARARNGLSRLPAPPQPIITIHPEEPK